MDVTTLNVSFNSDDSFPEFPTTNFSCRTISDHLSNDTISKTTETDLLEICDENDSICFDILELSLSSNDSIKFVERANESVASEFGGDF